MVWLALGEYRGPVSCKAFVHYLAASYERNMREYGYRVYVTDMLRNIPQMTYITTRWADALKSNVREERTAEQIVDDVVASLSGGGK